MPLFFVPNLRNHCTTEPIFLHFRIRCTDFIFAMLALDAVEKTVSVIKLFVGAVHLMPCHYNMFNN